MKYTRSQPMYLTGAIEDRPNKAPLGCTYAATHTATGPVEQRTLLNDLYVMTEQGWELVRVKRPYEAPRVLEDLPMESESLVCSTADKAGPESCLPGLPFKT